MTGTSSPRILLVDDDHEIVRVLRAYLEQANFHVDMAYDGGDRAPPDAPRTARFGGSRSHVARSRRVGDHAPTTR